MPSEFTSPSRHPWPTSAIVSPYGRDLVALQFPAGHKLADWSGFPVQVRGAISWPGALAMIGADKAIGDAYGVILVAARHARTGVVAILREAEWRMVDDVHVTDETPILGAWREFPAAFSGCICRQFWYVGGADNESASDYHRTAIRRMEQIQPKPWFVANDDGLNNEAALMRALSMVEAGRLKYPDGGPSFRAISHRLPNMPESQAIGALALGFSQLRMPQI